MKQSKLNEFMSAIIVFTGTGYMFYISLITIIQGL